MGLLTLSCTNHSYSSPDGLHQGLRLEVAPVSSTVDKEIRGLPYATLDGRPPIRSHTVLEMLVVQVVFKLPKVKSHRGSVRPQILVCQMVLVREKLLMHGPEHSLLGGGFASHRGTDGVGRALSEGKMPKCIPQGNGLAAVLRTKGIPNLLHSPINAAACGTRVVAVLHDGNRGVVWPERVVLRLDGWVQANGFGALH